MAHVTVTKPFDAPPERVFAALTDLRNADKVIRAIKKLDVLTDGPVGVGTRFRETRTMFGKEATEVMEIVAFDPPRSFETRAESHGCVYRCTMTVKPSGSGSVVQIYFEAEAVSMMAKIMSVAMKPMMKACIKAFEADLDDIQASIGGDGSSAATLTAT